MKHLNPFKPTFKRSEFAEEGGHNTSAMRPVNYFYTNVTCHKKLILKDYYREWRRAPAAGDVRDLAFDHNK